MPLDISLARAELVALWVESVIFGAYAVLFCLCIHVLLFVQRRSNGVNKPLLLSAIAMFTLSMAHMIIELVQAIRNFIHDGSTSGQHDVSIVIRLTILQRALYVTNKRLGDISVLHCMGLPLESGCHPMLMLIGTTVCGYFGVYKLSLASDLFDLGSAESVALAFFCLTLATNLLVTSLISARIYWIGRQLRASLGPGHGRKYNYSMAIVLESGALYSITLLILLIMVKLRVNSGYIVSNALAQIMGFVPTLIIVRIGLGISTQASNMSGTTLSNSYRLSVPVRVRKVVNVDTDGTDSMHTKHHEV